LAFGTSWIPSCTVWRSRGRRGLSSTACGSPHRRSEMAIRYCGRRFGTCGPITVSVKCCHMRVLIAFKLLVICVWGERSVNRRVRMGIRGGRDGRWAPWSSCVRAYCSTISVRRTMIRAPRARFSSS
jgi:hypothetical protein